MMHEPRPSPSGPLLRKTPQPQLYYLRNIKRVFPGQYGIQIDELTLPVGRMVVLLGESGSGKSTLLNLLGGLAPGERVGPNSAFLMRPQSRESGKPIDLLEAGNLAGEERRVGFVFQSGHLMRDASVSANLAVSQVAAGQPINGRRIATVCDDLTLRRELGVCRARILSGGKSQRVAVARAILRDPEIVLADEPTASLDLTKGLEVMSALARWRLADSDRRTVIWVTHNWHEAAIFADDVVVLKKGRLAPGRVWPQPNPYDARVMQAWVAGTYEVQVHPNSVRYSRKMAALWFGDDAGPSQWAYMSRRPDRPKPEKSLGLSLIAKLAAAALFSSSRIDSDNPQRPWLVHATAFTSRFRRLRSARNSPWPALSRRFIGFNELITTATGLTLEVLAGFLWPRWSRFERRAEVGVSLVLLLFLMSLTYGDVLLDNVFAARLATPELSHLVINGNRLQDPLTDDRLGEIQQGLESEGLATKVAKSASPSCAPAPKIAGPAGHSSQNEDNYRCAAIFGRWEMHSVQVARRERSDSADTDAACKANNTIGAATILVADTREPVFAALEYLHGTSPATLAATDATPILQGLSDVPVVGVSRHLVERILGYDANHTIDDYFCVYLRAWRLVRMSHIVTRLPSDGEDTFDIVVQRALYLKALPKRDAPPDYASAAIYIEPASVEKTLNYLSGIVGMPGGLSAEGGFRKIKAALELWNLTSFVLLFAKWAAFFLTGALIVRAAWTEIIENDKALCVLRAFGMKAGHIFLFVWFQATTILSIALALSLPLTFAASRYFAYDLPSVLELKQDALPSVASALGRAVGYFALIVTLGCIAATAYWWQQSKLVAQRLQRLT